MAVKAPELYDLDADPGEKHDVSMDYPDVQKKMLEYVEQARADLGDDLVQRKGTGRREPGRVTGNPVYPSDEAFPKGNLLKP